MHVETTLERVKNTLCVQKSHSYVLKSHSGMCSEKIIKNRHECVKISHANPSDQLYDTYDITWLSLLSYHSAYYIVYHRFLPKTYTKLFSIKGCCFCCCCFQCNFPYLIVGIRAWFAGNVSFSLVFVSIRHAIYHCVVSVFVYQSKFNCCFF
jgi:hypothetical protein